jgi:hypothetical protein
MAAPFRDQRVRAADKRVQQRPATPFSEGTPRARCQKGASIPMSRHTKASETTGAQHLIAGMNKHFSNASSLTFDSTTYTPQQIVTGLRTLINLRADVTVAKSAVKAKLATEKAQLPTILLMMAGLVQFLMLTFSKQPDVLADFGLVPKKAPPPLTVEQ